MNYYNDFRIYTSFGNGFFSPKRIVKMVSDWRLKYFSITDVNSIDGMKKAKQYLKNQDIELINGVEIITWYRDKLFTVLYYGFDLDFIERIELFSGERRYYHSTSINNDIKFQTKFFNLKYDENFSKENKVSFPHIQFYKHLASFEENEEFFQYCSLKQMIHDPINTKNLLPFNYKVYEPLENLKKIKEVAGGKIFFCNSLIYKDMLKDKNFLLELKEKELIDGIDCYGGTHSIGEIYKLLFFANANNLLVSGGSCLRTSKQLPGYCSCKKIIIPKLGDIIKLSN